MAAVYLDPLTGSALPHPGYTPEYFYDPYAGPLGYYGTAVPLIVPAIVAGKDPASVPSGPTVGILSPVYGPAASLGSASAVLEMYTFTAVEAAIASANEFAETFEKGLIALIQSGSVDPAAYAPLADQVISYKDEVLWPALKAGYGVDYPVEMFAEFGTVLATETPRYPEWAAGVAVWKRLEKDQMASDAAYWATRQDSRSDYIAALFDLPGIRLVRDITIGTGELVAGVGAGIKAGGQTIGNVASAAADITSSTGGAILAILAIAVAVIFLKSR